jgi:hypothetical protein
MQRLRTLALLPLLIAFAATASATLADTSTQLFQAAAHALDQGAISEAIDDLELLSDRGFRHPDASFDRAAAYVARARSAQARPGDLGRAAAALSETLVDRPDDDEARAALDGVRAEISRRRVRQGSDPVIARPSLLRAVIGVFSEEVWAAGAVLGALALSIGLGLRLWTRRPHIRLTGSTAASIGAIIWVSFGAATLAEAHLRRTSDPAVVVVPDARLLDEHGIPVAPQRGLESTSIPEGADVYVRERRGPMVRVEWGSSLGWISSTDVRVIAAR